MNYIEILAIVGLMIVVVAIYFAARKFISWAIDDDNNWLKKTGRKGYSKESIKSSKDIAYTRLNEGLLFVMAFLLFLLIKTIIDGK